MILMEIIGWERPEDKAKIPTENWKAPDIEAVRPEACPTCGCPAREGLRLNVVGHGWYERWARLPQGIKIRIRRFLCKRCRATCSVLPHWLLPRFQYTAPVILSSLQAYHLASIAAPVVTAAFDLSARKHGWGTLRRWGSAFLVCSALWGWLGKGLGVREKTAWSRDRVRIHVERFMLTFADRTGPWSHADVTYVVRRTLKGMVFDRHGAPSRHAWRGRRGAAAPEKPRFVVPTQAAGPPRGPP